MENPDKVCLCFITGRETHTPHAHTGIIKTLTALFNSLQGREGWQRRPRAARAGPVSLSPEHQLLKPQHCAWDGCVVGRNTKRAVEHTQSPVTRKNLQKKPRTFIEHQLGNRIKQLLQCLFFYISLLSNCIVCAGWAGEGSRPRDLGPIGLTICFRK